MAVIKIYEPSMCCSTGVCGPSVDTELLRITAAMNQLNKTEKQMERFNLNDHPMVFVENQLVNQLLNNKGVDVLPITVVDDKVVKMTAYPTNEDIENYLSVKLEASGTENKRSIDKPSSSNCNCGGGGCC